MKRLLATVIFAVGISSSVHAQTPANEVRSFVGRKFILYGHGAGKVNMADLSKPVVDGCGTPIEILDASYSDNQIRFDLENIGSIQLNGNGANSRAIVACSGTISANFKLMISDVRSEDLTAGLETTLGNLLMTPDAFLAFNGIQPAAPSTNIPGKTQPRILLMIPPQYTDSARKARLQGSVDFSFVVGADGRIEDPKIVQGLGSGLDEQTLRVLPMWRFEPARLDGKPVATQTKANTVFHLY